MQGRQAANTSGVDSKWQAASEPVAYRLCLSVSVSVSVCLSVCVYQLVVLVWSGRLFKSAHSVVRMCRLQKDAAKRIQLIGSCCSPRVLGHFPRSEDTQRE